MHHADEVNIKNFVIKGALASVNPSIVDKSLHLASKKYLSFAPNIFPVRFYSYILYIGKIEFTLRNTRNLPGLKIPHFSVHIFLKALIWSQVHPLG